MESIEKTCKQKDIQIINKKVEDEKKYIKNPIEFVYEALKYNVENDDIVSYGLKKVLEHNIKIIEKKKEELRLLEKQIEPREEIKIIKEKINVPKKEYVYKPRNNIEKILEDMSKINEYEEIELYMNENTYAKGYIKEIKLYFYKKILDLKKEIKTTLINDYTLDIRKYQDRISSYELILYYIDEIINGKEEKIELEEDTEILDDRIIFLPNSKGSSYFIDDIYETARHVDMNKISHMVKKVINGYFIECGDKKNLVSYDKLSEYRNVKAKLRILYKPYKGKIVICSIFYKDQQKDIQTTAEYKEAVKRFSDQEKSLDIMMDLPTFKVDQYDIVGQISQIFSNNVVEELGVGNE